MNKKNPQAFSIIELSLVLFIVGFLVFGVLAGKQLVATSQLAKAQSLTGSSSVGGIEDLVVWFETTRDSSFLTGEAVDGGLVSQWNDINPRLQNKKNVTASGTSRPTYVEKAINGLPALLFNGTINNLARTTSGSELSASNEITIFVVSKVTNLSQTGSVIYWEKSNGLDRINIHLPHNSNVYFDYGGSPSCCGADGRITAATPANFVNNWHITSAIKNSSGVADVSIDNSVLISGSSMTATHDTSASSTFYVGANVGNYFAGYIGEIIIFDRALSIPERLQVTQYLSKKWGIGIS